MRTRNRGSDEPGEVWGEAPPVVRPPDTFTVEHERKPLLYLPDGRALVRRPVGFRTEPSEGGK